MPRFTAIAAALLSVIILHSCGQEPPVQKRVTIVPHIDTSANSRNFYRRFEGRLGSSAFVLHLMRNGSALEGVITTTGRGTPVHLWPSEDSTSSDELFLFTEIDPFNRQQSSDAAQWRLRRAQSGWSALRIPAGGTASAEVPLFESYPSGSIRLSAFSLTDTAFLLEDKDEPRATASYKVVLPDATMPSSAFVSSSIRSIMGLDETIDPISLAAWEQGLSKKIADYFERYRSELQGTYTEEDSNSLFAYNYIQDVTLSIFRNDKDWLGLCRSDAEYTGGAHGNAQNTYYNLDLKQQRVWNLTDIVTDSNALSPLLTQAARRTFGLKPGELLEERILVNAVPATSNVCVLADGLSFVYNPYEIASYADGEIQLFLPWQQVQLLLTPAFRERMGLIRSRGKA